MLSRWPLDPAVTYLNHGTVGVAPNVVLARQQAIRDEIERQPSKFMLRDLSGWVGGRRERPTLMREAAAVVARFVGAQADDLVFVDNATAGANAVLRSLPLEAGDEVLVTDFGYGAVTKAAHYAARTRGATVRTVTMPYPRFDTTPAARGVRVPEQGQAAAAERDGGPFAVEFERARGAAEQAVAQLAGEGADEQGIVADRV